MLIDEVPETVFFLQECEVSHHLQSPTRQLMNALNVESSLAALPSYLIQS